MNSNIVKIWECERFEDLEACARLQREVFALPDIEISPLRHLVVTKNAGGFTLGAFVEEKLVGFVLSVPGFLGEENFFYSHMTAVKKDFQNLHIGARLKWAQRERALKSGVKFIKWTFQPVQARNAFFNLVRLGAVIKDYAPNFYGTDYSTIGAGDKKIGLDSDRLFAEWDLESKKVKTLAGGEKFEETGEPVQKIEIPNDWNNLVETNPQKAVAEQTRIRNEFQEALTSENLICKSFERSDTNPKYLLYKEN